MRFRVPSLALLLTAVSFAVPLAAHAAIPFFGPIIPQSDNLAICPAGWGMLIDVINHIISFLITVAIVFVAPIMIAWSGFLFVINPVNPSKKEEAKGILWRTVIGIVIALASWLIVDAIMAALTTGPNGPTFAHNWSALITSDGASQCLPQQGALPGGALNQAVPGTGITTTPISGVGGACTVPNSGPCAPTNLQNSCFGSNAGAAGQVCSKESVGIPAALSKGDITADGKAYSVGLFQINITNSYSMQVDGQSCANAFTQPCQNSGGFNNVQPSGACSSSIKTGSCGLVSCSQLYQDCVLSAQDANNNIKSACQLSSNGASWGPWRNTALTCGLILR